MGHILLDALILSLDGTACTTTRSVFDIFIRRPVQSAVQWSRVNHYKPIAPVDQSELEFVTTSDAETYLDLDNYVLVRGKLVAEEGSALDPDASISVVNNPISQCSVTLNGVSVSSSKNLYNYRAYLETLHAFGHDATQTYLTSALWYPDEGDFLA